MRNRSQRGLKVVLPALLLILTLVTPVAPAAAAPSDAPLAWVWMTVYNGPGFRNRDYHAQTTDTSASNASMPAKLIFTNGGWINVVKNGLAEAGYTKSGDTKNGFNSNGGYYIWDSDNGRKHCYDGAFGVFQECRGSTHYRIYADPNYDANGGYSAYWGYWSFATAHQDVDENTSNAQFGYNDEARDAIAADAESIWPPSSNNGLVNAWNEYNRFVANSNTSYNVYQSDGYAYRLDVGGSYPGGGCWRCLIDGV